MLRICPEDRLTAAAAMRSPFFSRGAPLELPAACEEARRQAHCEPLDFEFEHMRGTLTAAKLRELLWSECERY
jgi:hypothetical protein